MIAPDLRDRLHPWIRAELLVRLIVRTHWDSATWRTMREELRRVIPDAVRAPAGVLVELIQPIRWAEEGVRQARGRRDSAVGASEPREHFNTFKMTGAEP